MRVRRRPDAPLKTVGAEPSTWSQTPPVHACCMYSPRWLLLHRHQRRWGTAIAVVERCWSAVGVSMVSNNNCGSYDVRSQQNPWENLPGGEKSDRPIRGRAAVASTTSDPRPGRPSRGRHHPGLGGPPARGISEGGGLPPDPLGPRVARVAVVLLVTLGLALVADRAAPQYTAWVWLGSVIVTVASLLVLVLEVRAWTRRRLIDSVIVALAPRLGLRNPSRSCVRARRWAGGWIGTPRKISIRYGPGADDGDPVWSSKVLTELGMRLEDSYEVLRHDTRHQLLVIRQAREPAPTESCELVDRAEHVSTELFGQSSTARASLDDEGNLTAVVVTHDIGPKVASIQVRARIERIVTAMLPGRWRASWNLESDSVQFELRPELPTVIEHPSPGQITAANRYRLSIGVDEDQHDLVWDLQGDSPHRMVTGPTGKGKTKDMTGVVMEFAYRGWPVWIVDPKRIEFIGLRGWPNIQIIAIRVPEQVALLYRAHEEMERRYQLIEEGEADEADFEPLLVVLDEYRMFYAAVTAWYAGIKQRGMPSKCPVFDMYANIARAGRAAGVHLLMGTQRPDAEWVTGEMRDNFDTRTSLGRLSRQGAEMMWEAAYIGVAVPRVRGRGTSIGVDGFPTESQAYWTPDPRRVGHGPLSAEADAAILDRLRPPEVSHHPLRVQLDEDVLAQDPTGQWAAVIEAELVPATDDQHAADRRDEAGQARPALRLVSPDDVAPTVPQDTQALPDDVADTADNYDDPITVACSQEQVQPGDLVLVDDTLDIWGVVEAAEPDLLDDGLFCVSWRGDDDASGEVQISHEETLTVRRASTPEERT